MLSLRSPPYVCWRCLAHKGLPSSTVRRAVGRLPQARIIGPVAHEQAITRSLATVQHSNDAPATQEPVPGVEHSKHGPKLPKVRDRLRAWEAANPDPADLKSRELPGSTSNTQRIQSPFLAEIQSDMDTEDFADPLFDGEDLIDLRSNPNEIKAGDLVEIKENVSRTNLVAVCLGEFNGYQHYYTEHGKWFTTYGVRTLFAVKEFAKPSEIQPLVDSLPPLSASIGYLNILQPLKAGPSRDLGASLIRKMNSFLTASRFVYQVNAEKLDNAFRYVGGKEKTMPLADIAEVLLHRGFKSEGAFTPAALYAVHKALCKNDVAFLPVNPINHTKNSIFQLRSEVDVRLVDRIDGVVQAYYEEGTRIKAGKRDTRLENSPFGKFIRKARAAIDESRRSRDWSPHGTLKPSSKPVSMDPPPWSTSLDFELLRFMHIWGATQSLGPSSRRYIIGAGILRALDRYGDTEFLDQQVAWTFLQEIGWIKPWEIQARYRLRSVGVKLERGGGIVGPTQTTTAPPPPRPEADLFAGRRKDLAGARVFCVDAETTVDIDDGISLERTETQGEYWIHIHTADPASCLRVGSPLADHAAVVPLTVYLPGHFARMFGNDPITREFSLGPNKPCLTFSARVNEQGALLDYKITPGLLRDVVYMTGAAVSTACGEEPRSASRPSLEAFAVGTPPTAKYAPTRHMTKAEELSAEDVDDLRILRRLADAAQARRVSNGAMPDFYRSSGVEVSFDKVETVEFAGRFMRCSGDPYIRISYEDRQGIDIVNSTMQLAGEVAARWCHDRGIPIPYKVQPRAVQNIDRLRKYTSEVIYPLLAKRQRPSDSQWRIMMSLSGGYDISTRAAPYFTMGVDMYTKATSPLRRYSDLLVHWQIEAALLEEERRGESLVGNMDDTFLPFTRDELEEQVFPLLRVRESNTVTLSKSVGVNEWMLQALVRVWKFGDKVTEGSPLPKTFRYTVLNVVESRALKGMLDWFDRQALMDSDGLANAIEDGQAMILEDVQAGDVFEVELSDVVVSSGKIKVKALRRLERGPMDAIALPSVAV